jgi:hypothetical protein
MGTRPFQHRFGHVQADGAPGGSHLVCSQQGVDPPAAAQVEDDLARTKVGVADRVA